MGLPSVLYLGLGKQPLCKVLFHKTLGKKYTLQNWCLSSVFGNTLTSVCRVFSLSTWQRGYFQSVKKDKLDQKVVCRMLKHSAKKIIFKAHFEALDKIKLKSLEL